MNAPMADGIYETVVGQVWQIWQGRRLWGSCGPVSVEGLALILELPLVSIEWPTDFEIPFDRYVEGL